MRYPSDHKARTRTRLLDTAGALAKRDGFGATGVDTLMKEAGLTAGAFYNHFESKAELLVALMDHELERSFMRFPMDSTGSMKEAFDRYLSVAHVERPERGCVLPALSAEVGRANDASRQVFEDHLQRLKARIADQLPDKSKAWSLLCQTVGAVMLSRAVKSRKARTAILNGVRQSVCSDLGMPGTDT